MTETEEKIDAMAAEIHQFAGMIIKLSVETAQLECKIDELTARLDAMSEGWAAK